MVSIFYVSPPSPSSTTKTSDAQITHKDCDKETNQAVLPPEEPQIQPNPTALKVPDDIWSDIMACLLLPVDKHKIRSIGTSFEAQVGSKLSRRRNSYSKASWNFVEATLAFEALRLSLVCRTFHDAVQYLRDSYHRRSFRVDQNLEENVSSFGNSTPASAPSKWLRWSVSNSDCDAALYNAIAKIWKDEDLEGLQRLDIALETAVSEKHVLEEECGPDTISTGLRYLLEKTGHTIRYIDWHFTSSPNDWLSARTLPVLEVLFFTLDETTCYCMYEDGSGCQNSLDPIHPHRIHETLDDEGNSPEEQDMHEVEERVDVHHHVRAITLRLPPSRKFCSDVFGYLKEYHRFPLLEFLHLDGFDHKLAASKYGWESYTLCVLDVLDVLSMNEKLKTISLTDITLRGTLPSFEHSPDLPSLEKLDLTSDTIYKPEFYDFLLAKPRPKLRVISFYRVAEEIQEFIDTNATIYQAASLVTKLLSITHKRWKEGFLSSLKKMYVDISSGELGDLRLEAKKGWVDERIINVEVWKPDFINNWVEFPELMGVELFASDCLITNSVNSSAELDRRREEHLLEILGDIAMDPDSADWSFCLPDPPLLR